MRKRLEWLQKLTALAKECHYHSGELAARLGVSPRWLQRWFKRNLHTTPSAFLAHLRSGEAWRLADSKLSAQRIAELVGFANSQNLSRGLKQDCGFVLSQFRRKKSSPADTKTCRASKEAQEETATVKHLNRK